MPLADLPPLDSIELSYHAFGFDRADPLPNPGAKPEPKPEPNPDPDCGCFYFKVTFQHEIASILDTVFPKFFLKTSDKY